MMKQPAHIGKSKESITRITLFLQSPWLQSSLLLPLSVFIIGVLFSALGAVWFHLEIKTNAQAEFQRNVERVSGEVVRRFTQPVYGLNGARGTYAANQSLTHNQNLTRSQFIAYVRSRDLPHEFPGVRGFGFIRHIERNQLDDFLATTRADGAPQYNLRQLKDKNLNDLYIIQYIEPVKGNESAVGLDLGSEAVRREAVLHAIDSGETTLTGPIKLVQDHRDTPGVLLYVPVYNYGIQPTSVTERRSSLVGILYAPIIITDLLHDIPEFVTHRVNVQLFDSEKDTSAESLIFDTNTLKNTNNDQTTRNSLSGKPDNNADNIINDNTFVQTKSLSLPGRMMILRITSTAQFEARLERYTPWLLFAFGIILSASLALLIRQQVNGRSRAEILARSMTADLERLALVARNTSNAVIITDVSRHIIWANEGFERITGYSCNEVIGQSPGNLLQCDATNQVTVQNMRAMLDAGQAFKGELINRHKSGELYWIEMEIQPRHDHRGELIGFMAIESNISERKATQARLEDALRDNNALLSTLNMHGIISTTDPTGAITDVNEAFCRISCYQREELIGHTPHIVNSDTHSKAFWNAMWNNIHNGIPWRGEVCNRAKDGTLYWVDTTIAPFKNSDGQIEKYISIQTDITATKNQQTNLTIARNQLVRAADMAELGIWTWRVADNTLSFDERMNEIYQIPLELRDKPLPFHYWHNALHPNDAAVVDKEIAAVLKNGDIFRHIFRIIINGHTRFIQSAGMVEHDDNGNVIMMSGINRDITVQRETEEVLQAARLAADEANQAKSAFLANMSHELRTPMNAILGMLTLLRRTGLNKKQAEYAVKSEEATRTLLRLLNDILDFSKIEAGKMVLDPHSFDINQLLRDLSVILSSNMPNKPVEVLFDIDPKLPRFLMGDSMRLQQVLINLAGNAIKFTEQGEIVVFIQRVTGDEQQVVLHFGVRDTGIGIAPEHQTRIFSGFTQAEASITRRFGGSGLGLVISQHFVNLMGGNLELESQVGQGSLFHFTITLPITSAPPTVQLPSNVKESTQMLPVSHVTKEKLRVLVADDNATSCKLIKQMGKSLGWEVDIAHDGKQVMWAMQQCSADTPYHVLFLDAHMPGLDGWQSGKIIRQWAPAEKMSIIITVSAHDHEILLQPTEEEQTYQDGFLVKPFTASMLLDAVSNARAPFNPHPDASSPDPSRQQLLGVRLLIVEDNLNNQQIARELLEDEGAIVHIANHGQEAIDILKQSTTPFDAILMDLQMPVMDGFSATHYIRNEMGLKTLPIVAMTANAMVSDHEACLAAGMNDHVGKPFDLQYLIQVLHKYVHPAQPSTSPLTPKVTSALTELLKSTPLQTAIATSGIELETALSRLGGDIELYRKMVTLFLADLVELPTQLNMLIEQDDRAAASRVLHTIKGLSAQLGASTLSVEAAIGEKLLLGTPPPSDEEITQLLTKINRQISLTHSNMMALHQILTTVTSSSVSTENNAVEPTPTPAPDILPEVDPATLEDALHHLIHLLQESNMAALTTMTQLSAHWSSALGESGLSLHEAVHKLDFARAIQLTTTLLSHIGSKDKRHEHD